MPALTTWIALPLLGGVIGYVTNRIAVKMIFRPIRPISFLGIRVQGLIGKRQHELAESIGRVVGDHLVQHKDIVGSLAQFDFEKLLAEIVDRGIGPKIEELRALPLIGGFLTEERITEMRESIVARVLSHKDVILERLEDAVEKGLDVQALVREKVSALSIEKLESLVLEVASRELRAIEALGAVLGVLIGIGQVLLVWGLA